MKRLKQVTLAAVLESGNAVWNRLKRAPLERVLVYARSDPTGAAVPVEEIRSRLPAEVAALAVAETVSEQAAVDSDPFRRPLLRAKLLLRLDAYEEIMPRRSATAAPSAIREDLKVLQEDLQQAINEVERALERTAAEPPAAGPDGAGQSNPPATTQEAPATTPGPTPADLPPPAPVRTRIFDGVVFMDLADIAAHPVTLARFLAALVAASTHVIVVNQSIDTRTTSGREMVRAILEVGALWQRAARARSTAIARRKLDAGEAFGEPRFAFKREGDRFVPVPAELEVVRKILDLRAQGKSLAAIADILNRAGMKDPSQLRRGKPWLKDQVRRIVRDQDKYGPFLDQAPPAGGPA